MNFPSIGVKGVANYYHQQSHCHQIKNLFGVDTLDDPVFNLNLHFGGWSGKWLRFKSNWVWKALILFCFIIIKLSIKDHSLKVLKPRIVYWKAWIRSCPSKTIKRKFFYKSCIIKYQLLRHQLRNTLAKIILFIKYYHFQTHLHGS